MLLLFYFNGRQILEQIARIYLVFKFYFGLLWVVSEKRAKSGRLWRLLLKRKAMCFFRKSTWQKTKQVHINVSILSRTSMYRTFRHYSTMVSVPTQTGTFRTYQHYDVVTQWDRYHLRPTHTTHTIFNSLI